MLAHCPLAKLRALVWIAAVATASPLAAETTATPPALPQWPDEAPSVYATARIANDQPPPAPISSSPIDAGRRLAPRGDRQRPHAAQRDGADASRMPLPSFGLPLDSIYTTVTALAVVVGLFLTCAGLVRRGAKKSNSLLPEEVVSVLGRVPLAARQFAELVRVGNKLVLLSVTQHGAEPLTEITDPVEFDRLVGLCQQRSTRSTTAEFDQVFRELAEEAAPTGFLGHEADLYSDYRGGAIRA